MTFTPISFWALIAAVLVLGIVLGWCASGIFEWIKWKMQERSFDRAWEEEWKVEDDYVDVPN